MLDEKTIFMGCGKNRTFSYLQENPNAVFAIMEPGQTPRGMERGEGLPEDDGVPDVGREA